MRAREAENCDGRGLIYCASPVKVGWVVGNGWMPIWLTNADQLRSSLAEPGCQPNPPKSARVTCRSSENCVFCIWSLIPGCSKVSWNLWNGTLENTSAFGFRTSQYRTGTKILPETMLNEFFDTFWHHLAIRNWYHIIILWFALLRFEWPVGMTNSGLVPSPELHKRSKIL